MRPSGAPLKTLVVTVTWVGVVQGAAVDARASVAGAGAHRPLSAAAPAGTWARPTSMATPTATWGRRALQAAPLCWC